MKYILLTLALLTACATSTPPVASSDLVVEKTVQPMSRNEVIMAIGECESSGMRAVPIISKRKINNYNTDIVVDVTCAPRNKH